MLFLLFFFFYVSSHRLGIAMIGMCHHHELHYFIIRMFIELFVWELLWIAFLRIALFSFSFFFWFLFNWPLTSNDFWPENFIQYSFHQFSNLSGDDFLNSNWFTYVNDHENVDGASQLTGRKLHCQTTPNVPRNAQSEKKNSLVS